MKDAVFLAGLFFEYEIPKDRLFLFKYFRTPLEQQFVKYYLCFGEIENFVDHTGYFCQKRWVRLLKKRMDKLLKIHETYKNNFELDKLREVEEGRLKKL
jgi:hypothetical protein